MISNTKLWLLAPLLIAQIFATHYQGDRPSKAAYTINIPVVNKARSYEFYVHLDDSYKTGDSTYIGFNNRREILPVLIRHDDRGNEIVKVSIKAYEKPNSQESMQKVASNLFTFKAPKGTFKQVKEIDVNFSKKFNISGKPKFTISFKPDTLPIQ